jgi:hypothetical protein
MCPCVTVILFNRLYLALDFLERVFYNFVHHYPTQSKENTMSKRNVVHVEIPASNVKSASKFYEALFGWKMEHVPEFDYTMWEDGSGYGGGFNSRRQESVGLAGLHPQR